MRQAFGSILAREVGPDGGASPLSAAHHPTERFAARVYPVLGKAGVGAVYSGSLAPARRTCARSAAHGGAGTA
jgi:hypothetical protein